MRKMIEKIKKSKAGEIFFKALGFRILCALLSLIIFLLFNDHHETVSFADFLSSFVRWDGSHYLNLARNGYINAVEDGKHLFLVFYPLYPWLIRVLQFLIHNYELAGIIVSFLCYAAGCCFFYFLMEQEYGEWAAVNAVTLISVFPFGFYFGMIMTESLYFLVAGAFFYYARKHKWGLVAVWGILACLTKVQAVLLFLVAFTEICYCEKPILLIKERKIADIWKRCICPLLLTAIMFAGTFIYLGINYYVEGDPFQFMYYQRTHWGNALCFMPQTLKYIFLYVKNEWFTSVSMAIWIPELFLFFFYIVNIIYGFLKKMRITYLVYLICFFVLTYSSTWLISGGRYTLSALPVFMIGGQWVSRHEKAGRVIYFVSTALFMVYFIGNFMWKQVM